MQPIKEEQVQTVEQPKKEETTTSKLFYDVVNVSEGFQLRTAYKKKVKPSKLDGLLERRVKQFTLEEKQRLERMRQAALLSKTAASRPPSGVKTEGSAAAKQPPAVSPCVKVEEEEGLQVKDGIVKKLNFEQEQTDVKTNDTDVKFDSTASNNSKQTEVSGAEGNGGAAAALNDVNGGSLATAGLNSKNNCISEAIENKEKTQRPEVAWENAKKRGYEEMAQSSDQKDPENMEVEQSRTSPVQVNGETVTGAPAHSDVNSDPDGRDQGEVKEPVKSLMNGNFSQNDLASIDGPPPLKVPKLENHIAEKGDSLSAVSNKNQDVPVGSGGAAPAKLSSSSLSSVNSNNTDISSSSEGLKTSPQGSVTTNTNTTDPQNTQKPDMSSSVSKPAATSQAASSAASSTTTSTAKPRSLAPGTTPPQKTKPLTAAVPDTKLGTTSSSMTISKEYTTRGRVSLLRFSKCKKARSGTALPSYRKFVTKSSKKSIFILPNDDLQRLARRAGIREVPIFSYNAKPAQDIWPYPSPRPTFGITWRLVTHLNHHLITAW